MTPITSGLADWVPDDNEFAIRRLAQAITPAAANLHVMTNRLLMDVSECGITDIIGGDWSRYPRSLLKPRQSVPARMNHNARLAAQFTLSSAPSRQDQSRQGHANA